MIKPNIQTVYGKKYKVTPIPTETIVELWDKDEEKDMTEVRYVVVNSSGEYLHWQGESFWYDKQLGGWAIVSESKGHAELFADKHNGTVITVSKYNYE